jgi:hypothetical protein
MVCSSRPSCRVLLLTPTLCALAYKDLTKVCQVITIKKGTVVEMSERTERRDKESYAGTRRLLVRVLREVSRVPSIALLIPRAIIFSVMPTRGALLSVKP